MKGSSRSFEPRALLIVSALAATMLFLQGGRAVSPSLSGECPKIRLTSVPNSSTTSGSNSGKSSASTVTSSSRTKASLSEDTGAQNSFHNRVRRCAEQTGQQRDSCLDTLLDETRRSRG